MKATAYQHQGTRPDQQDRYLCDPRGFCVVADGLGGHTDGALAAQTAVDIVARRGMRHLVERTLHLADRAVRRLGPCRVTGTLQHKMSCHCLSPGTTLTGLWFLDEVVLGHVGDSRCYALDQTGVLRQMSKDHGGRYGLTQFIGAMHEPQVEILPEACAWLLCSDGLTDALTCGELESLLLRGADAEALVDAALAKERERQDNITAVVVR